MLISTIFSLLECQCQKAEENICEKVTGKCEEDCNMGFYGDFCEKGNNERKYSFEKKNTLENLYFRLQMSWWKGWKCLRQVNRCMWSL